MKLIFQPPQGGLVLDGEGLAVPHPRLAERRFVLAPLVEIAAEMVHPVLEKTMAELLKELPEHGENGVSAVRRVAKERSAEEPSAKKRLAEERIVQSRVAESDETSICLVCWDEKLAGEKAARLGRDGFLVTVVSEPVKGWITYFRDLGVGAVVIDLDRLPSHGREIGVVLRGSKSTRHLPLVFLGGPAEKVERVREELPDAAFAGWDEAAKAIRSAITEPIDKPVRPVPMMERSRGQELSRKLGVKPAMPVVLWGDAEFLVELLGDVPVVKRVQGEMAHLCLCVTRAVTDVQTAFETVAAGYPVGTLMWIIHPKQTGRIKTDFNQNDVRVLGLARGWVDFKVCAVDADWSGLAFAKRRTGEALPRRSLNPRMLKGVAKTGR